MANNRERKLQDIPVDRIARNPLNPRYHFDQDKLDILAESIHEVGILVPLIAYEENDKYVLLDGERRWLCAKRLNIKTVPANLIAKPTKIENLLRMFNIHNVREEWELMPTALKLGEIIKELKTDNERILSELTGLNRSTIRRCKILLKLPKKYQKAVLNREYKADFFIEMEKVLRRIESNLPKLYEKYKREGLIDTFVELYNEGKIKSVTDFRLFQKVLQGEKIGVDNKSVKSLVERVIVDHELGLREAFDVIEGMVNVSKIEQSITRLTEAIYEFNFEKLHEQEKNKLKDTLIEFRNRIDELLENL